MFAFIIVSQLTLTIRVSLTRSIYCQVHQDVSCSCSNFIVFYSTCKLILKFHQEKVGKLYCCCRLTNSLQFPPLACTYTLQVHAHTYRNTYHLNSDAYCCEHYSWTNCLQSGWCTTTTCKCDNRFNFCLRNYGTGQDNNANNCPLGSKRTGLVYSDNDYFNFSSSMGGVSNPMSFTGSSWPVSIPPVFDHLCIQKFHNLLGGLSECIRARTVRRPLDRDSLA